MGQNALSHKVIVTENKQIKSVAGQHFSIFVNRNILKECEKLKEKLKKGKQPIIIIH